MTTDHENPDRPTSPEEIRGPVDCLRDAINRERYPGQAWPVRARRPSLPLWKWVAAGFAAAVLIAVGLMASHGIAPRTQTSPDKARDTTSVAVVTIPLSSSLDPCLGGGMPDEALQLRILVITHNGTTQVVGPMEWYGVAGKVD